MALVSVLETDSGSGGGGLVIWVKYPVLHSTGEWFLDYYLDVWNLDQDQTDALEELFVTKKGWEGKGAEQYQALYNTFLTQIYRPFFETKLCNIKSITIDAITGAAKLLNQCDDFYLALESDDYEPEIRMGRPDKEGTLMYNSSYKYPIVSHCEAAYTATEEEDTLLDEALAEVSDLHYPEFAFAMTNLSEKKDTFIKKQKRIGNYKDTYKDYTERVVNYDQEIADAYNAEVNENVAKACDYTPLSTVPPWEVDCASLWTSIGDTDSMVEFINGAPKDASVWSDATSEAVTIIYVNSFYNGNTEVITAFDDRFSITIDEGESKKWAIVPGAFGSSITIQLQTHQNYTVKIDPAVVDKMDKYMDKYQFGDAWTALNEEVHVSINVSETGQNSGLTKYTVTIDENGRYVTNVSITDVDGNPLGSTDIKQHNMWNEQFGAGVLQERRLNGETEAQLDAYVKSDQGVLDKYTNPYYRLTEEEEKDAQQRIDKFWEEHPEVSGIRENGDLRDMYLTSDNGMTFEEWLHSDEIGGKDVDMDVYYQAVQYYELEHKLSDLDAFGNGATEVFYNFEKATESVLDKIDGETDPEIEKLLYGVPDEHELELQAMSEELQNDRDLARQASKLQNPYAYTAGRITEMTVTTMAAGSVLGASGLVDQVASVAGGGKLATALSEIGLETLLVDVPTDTIPEMIANYNSGMPVDEVLKNAGINVLTNTGINALGDAIIPEIFGAGAKYLDNDVVKVAGEGMDDALQTSSDALKLGDDIADAGRIVPDAAKLVEDATDVTRALENGADIAKEADNAVDGARVADHASDAARVADNATDVARNTDNAIDAAKEAEHAAEASRTADHAADAAKEAEHAADAARAADHAADAAKEAEHASDAARTTDHAADAAKETEHATDAADHIAEDAAKNTADVEDPAGHVDNDNVHDTHTADDDYEPGIVVDKYKNFSKDEELKAIPGEAHHTFQNAAFEDVIDKAEANCVKLEGDLVKSPPGTPHYKFHEYMENFWDQFRSNGDRFRELPTVQEYSEAAENAYKYAGLDPADAHYAVECSKEQYAQWYTFRKIENEFGDAVGGFTGTERDAILSYIDDTIKGGNLENVDKTISQFISQEVSNSIYSRIEKEIGDRGMDYIDDVVGEAKISRIPNRINLNTE